MANESTQYNASLPNSRTDTDVYKKLSDDQHQQAAPKSNTMKAQYYDDFQPDKCQIEKQNCAEDTDILNLIQLQCKDEKLVEYMQSLVYYVILSVDEMLKDQIQSGSSAPENILSDKKSLAEEILRSFVEITTVDEESVSEQPISNDKSSGEEFEDKEVAENEITQNISNESDDTKGFEDLLHFFNGVEEPQE